MDPVQEPVNPRIRAAERQRRTLELRLAGYSFAAIADQVGYKHPSGASEALKQALKVTLQEPASEIRALEAERLDRLLLAWWPRAEAGQPEAFDKVLRLMERRARLLGLDQPFKVAPTDPEGEKPYPHAPGASLPEVLAILAECGAIPAPVAPVDQPAADEVHPLVPPPEAGGLPPASQP
jgi:hypothetical protein